MAREIKIVAKANGTTSVRGIPDSLARGEELIAARWQDGGEVFVFGDPAGWDKLRRQTEGVCLPNATLEDFAEYVRKTF